MKKLPFILALALMFASFAFAGENHKGKKIRINTGEWVEVGTKKFDYKKECPKYEIKDNDSLYYNGNKSNADMLGVLMSCHDKLKGYDKAKQRQEKRIKEQK